jgi:phosphatidylinositol glycan class S
MSATAAGSAASPAVAEEPAISAGEDEAPANAVSVATKKKEPPPEKPESIRLRALVIFSFWVIILVLGVPIWWKTTTIYRASLPLDEMKDWAEGRVINHTATNLKIGTNTIRHVDRSFHYEFL